MILEQKVSSNSMSVANLEMGSCLCMIGRLDHEVFEDCMPHYSQFKVRNALLQIEEPELCGIYYSLDAMPKKVQDELDSKQLLFSNNSPLLKHANAYNAWPEVLIFILK